MAARSKAAKLAAKRGRPSSAYALCGVPSWEAAHRRMITSKADRDRIRQMTALGRKRTVKPPKIEKMCEHEVWIWNRYLADVDSVMRREFLKSEGINQGTWVCVYFARMGNTTAHKIGFAVHADSRIKQLQTSSPVPVKIAAWINALVAIGFQLSSVKPTNKLPNMGSASRESGSISIQRHCEG